MIYSLLIMNVESVNVLFIVDVLLVYLIVWLLKRLMVNSMLIKLRNVSVFILNSCLVLV